MVPDHIQGSICQTRQYVWMRTVILARDTGVVILDVSLF